MPTELNNINFESLITVPYLEQWSGAWMIEPEAARTLADALERVDLTEHLREQMMGDARKPSGGDYIYTTVENGVATIEIRGTLMKHRMSMGLGMSTVELRREMRALMSDDRVSRVVMLIESPGGTAAGTYELAQEVARLNQAKPVVSFIEDMGASAAYWVASQASKVYANEMAKVGSIGTYAVVSDLSGAAAQQGIKVHVVRAGEYKGAGTPGTEVTAEQLADMQRIVNGINQKFLDGVSQGRNLTMARVEQLADGRVHLAPDAVELGLIDAFSTFESVMEQQAIPSPSPSPRSRSPKMATVNEIKNACPGIGSDRVLEFLEADKSLEECTAAWMRDLSTENRSLREQLNAGHAEMQEKLDATTKERVELQEKLDAVKSTPGVDPLPVSTSTDPSTSAREEWQTKVDAKVAAGMSMIKAAASVAAAFPELRERMIAEANS